MREWLDELIRLSEIRRTAMELPSGGEEYREDYEKALSALETVEGSLLLTVERDTVFFTLWRLADYYNNHLRQTRSVNLARSLYGVFIARLNTRAPRCLNWRGRWVKRTESRSSFLPRRSNGSPTPRMTPSWWISVWLET